MYLAGVRFFTVLLVAGSLVACGGGGGSSPSQAFASPTPLATPTATPVVNGSPGPITASWKGDGSYTAQSDPNWPLTFDPIPGDSVSSLTKGPPIVYTTLGQALTITFNQTNFYGLVPTSVTFINHCSGIGGSFIGNRQFRMTYTATGSTSCYAQFQGEAPGYYPGDGIHFQVMVPSGG
jgi:hypothetical protein